MEFREYLRIVSRRRHIVLPLVLVTFLASLILNLALPPVYKTDATAYVLAVLPQTPPGATEYYSPEYYRTVYSEYLADDLSVNVKSRQFADHVASRIQAKYGQKLDPNDIPGYITTKRQHRTVKVTIATGSEALTRRLGEAINDELGANGWRYITRVAGSGSAPVQINMIDPPRDPTAPGIIRRLLDVLLHSAVALVVGVGLAFLLHYLEDRVQDGDDAARVLGWPVLGAIPLEGTSGSRRAGGRPPAWAGLLPRGWRKTPAALVLGGIGLLLAGLAAARLA